MILFFFSTKAEAAMKKFLSSSSKAEPNSTANSKPRFHHPPVSLASNRKSAPSPATCESRPRVAGTTKRTSTERASFSSVGRLKVSRPTQAAAAASATTPSAGASTAAECWRGTTEISATWAAIRGAKATSSAPCWTAKPARFPSSSTACHFAMSRIRQFYPLHRHHHHPIRPPSSSLESRQQAASHCSPS